MPNLVLNGYPIFTDIDGDPLEDGYIFIGVAGLNPIANPLQAYWDAALTVPASNIRTSGGYPSFNGSPGRLYVANNYSIQVQDKRGTVVYTQLDSVDYFNSPGGQALLKVDTIADLRNTVPSDPNIQISVAGYYAVGDGGGGPTRYWSSGSTEADDNGRVIRPTSIDPADPGRWIWVHSGPVNVKWFGAVGDGVTDDSAAIRAALDSGEAYIPYGVFGVDSLQINTGDILRGSGARFWQVVTNKPDGTDVTILKYVGGGGVNSVVVKASAVAVGTRPLFQPDGSEDTFGFTLTDMIIDGNSVSEYGLYGARCGLGTNIENVIATGCTEHGVWLNEFWSSDVKSIFAIFNNNCGITLGRNTFGWSGSAVNAVNFGTLQAFANDLDGNFNETTAVDEGYGIGWFVGRSNNCDNIIVEDNDGPGLYIQTASGPNHIENIYTEINGVQAVTDGRATSNYGIVFDGTVNSVSLVISQIHKSAAAAQNLWLTGTGPGVGSDDCFVVRTVFGGLTIISEWSNYRLEEGVQVTTKRSIVGNFPKYNDPDTITPLPAITTLYADDTEQGTGSGRDAGNALTITDAVELAKILTTVTTVDMSAVTSVPAATVELDGKNMNRRLIIDGLATGRFFSVLGDPSLRLINWKTELTIQNMVSIDFVFLVDSKVRFFDDPIIRMDTGATLGAAIDMDSSEATILGTSSIQLAGSGAATKIGINMRGGSIAWFTGDATSVIDGETAGNNVIIEDVGAVKDSTGWRLATF